MQVLTPIGYVDAGTLKVGDQVCAFNAVTGVPELNTIDVVEHVDYAEWCRWWSIEDIVPPYTWYRLNGAPGCLFREQLVWRNGANVCHARSLVVGDIIHDDKDGDIPIKSIEVFEDRYRDWYRFEISGDHSYILDGLTVHNASQFWVGGTGTWDSSTTTHWANASGGTGGSGAVPGAADTVTLDASSGGGTVTLNFGGTVTIQSITMGLFTGTWDNSVHSNNFTFSQANNAFNGSGSGTRTYKVGSATYTFTTTSNGITPFNILTATNLTYTGGSETWVFSGTTQNIRLFQSASTVTVGTLTLNTNTGCIEIDENCTINTVNVNPGTCLSISAVTLTTTNLNVAGTSSSQAFICSSPGVFGTQGTISVASGTTTLNWCAIKDMNFQGGATFIANNSFNLSDNTGITINSPSSGGGGSFSAAFI